MKCEGEKTYTQPGDCPKCGMAFTKIEVKKEAKEFYCPMKCEGEKTYSENKGCPKCGMALVEKKAKKEEGDHSGHKH
jgi:ssDNA-binding Zn-finger/Zn-ribbon topoisomerase 1